MSIDLSFIGALSQSKAQRSAVSAQQRAIKKQREYLFENLDPAVLGKQALEADQARAKAQLALLKEIDPNLAAARGLSEQQMLDELANGGAGAKKVSDAAIQEALTGPHASDAKNQLIDAAMQHLQQGATLPPDVQAELVQAGLEQSGMATGRATAQGMGGTMLRTVLGQAGLNLKMARQAKAEELLASASNLEAQRQNVLNTLFPNLSALQSQNLARSAGVFNTAQSAVPNAGLSGTDVANIWMARVGAANSLTQQAGNVASQAALAQGNIWNSAMGSAGVNVNQAIDIGKKIWGAPSTTPAATSAAVDASIAAGPSYGGGGGAGAGADFGGEM